MMANFTNFTNSEGLSYETVQRIACTASLHGEYYFYSLTAVNIFLAIAATLGNALMLVALRKENTLHPPSKLMYQCLTVTDLCVGVLAQPLFVTQLMSAHHQRLQLCFTVLGINDVTGAIFSGISLLTLTALSVERLVALSLAMEYRPVGQVITLKRTRIVVTFIWIFNISTNILRNLWSYFLISRVISVVIYSSLAISAISYLKIYLTLRRHSKAMQDIVRQGQPNGGENPPNIARYRKTVSTALCVQLTMIACYLPYAVVVAMVRQSPSLNIVVRLTITLVFLNSSLNPILYCWKINGVRQAVKDIIGQLRNLSGSDMQSSRNIAVNRNSGEITLLRFRSYSKEAQST